MPDTSAESAATRDILVDRYRALLFPNRVRELRTARGRTRLMALAAALPDIPYIRLSKIERGEVFARSWEIRRIAEALGVAPEAVLIDVDAPDFDIAAWARGFIDESALDEAPQRFAMLVAATLRAHRAADRALTIAAIERDYGIPPVILSRFENAHKPIERWNPAALGSVLALLGVRDLDALRSEVEARYRSGALTPHLQAIANADDRIARTRERVAALRAELASASDAGAPKAGVGVTPLRTALPLAPTSRRIAVLGAPLPDGLIAAQPTEASVEAIGGAGPRAFALKIFRPSLGMGLPGQTTLILDPDRYPAPGGIVAVREVIGDTAAYRVLALTIGRDGVLRGHSIAPDYEVEIDSLDPATIATAVAAVFV